MDENRRKQRLSFGMKREKGKIFLRNRQIKISILQGFTLGNHKILC